MAKGTGLIDDAASAWRRGLEAGANKGEDLFARLGTADGAGKAAEDAKNIADNAEDVQDASELSPMQLFALRAGAQGTEVAESGRGALRTAGLTGLGIGGLYVGNNYVNEREDTKRYKELQDRIDAIRNNPNLSPTEKQRRIKQAREAYQRATSGGGGNGGPGLGTVVTYGVGAILAIYALKLAGVV